ncbi:MAG TPA: hypothetical protein VL404_01030 [Candidatus Eisenbacteria bacterium]|nr:hypothetical protein [Candidatus Eisenbacteria bacterium]
MKREKPRWSASNENGFTLLEVTLAALLLVGVIAGLFGSFVSANRWIQPQNNVGYNVARERLEWLYEAVRQDWWNSGGRPLSAGTYSEGAFAYDGVNYTRSYTVTSVDANGDATEDYRRVQVTVSW